MVKAMLPDTASSREGPGIHGRGNEPGWEC
jgi:hypothetical protein